MSELPSTSAIEHRDVEVNGVRLHCAVAGDGPLVILLHGFPDFWYGWRNQLPALAEAGFRAVAPDTRGCGDSQRPRRTADYRPRVLAADVAGLVRAFGAESAAVVGHDWGAGAAWYFAADHPELLARLVIMGGPHPARMGRALMTLRQLRRSWYMLAFQLPGLSEAALRRRDFAELRRRLREDLARPGTLSEEDIERYIENYRRPGALTAALSYYRAHFRHPRESLRPVRVDCPVLLVWGEEDSYVGPELARPDPRLVPDARVEVIPGARHFVQADAPERVNELLIDFLSPLRG
jgi:pimeloyl-ACP methyl ester carboxylesterase